mmetsp:Transcript_54993/g.146098  ORF Transcript_54993/g.146098 Transcript_54993/m.146098 type:complete len:263 (-) Transcript_54993:765-1553(-)
MAPVLFAGPHDLEEDGRERIGVWDHTARLQAGDRAEDDAGVLAPPLAEGQVQYPRAHSARRLGAADADALLCGEDLHQGERDGVRTGPVLADLYVQLLLHLVLQLVQILGRLRLASEELLHLSQREQENEALHDAQDVHNHLVWPTGRNDLLVPHARLHVRHPPRDPQHGSRNVIMTVPIRVHHVVPFFITFPDGTIQVPLYKFTLKLRHDSAKQDRQHRQGQSNSYNRARALCKYCPHQLEILSERSELHDAKYAKNPHRT